MVSITKWFDGQFSSLSLSPHHYNVSILACQDWSNSPGCYRQQTGIYWRCCLIWRELNNTTDHQSVGYTGNHMEFRGINPIWRIHGPVLLPKTRRIFVDPDDFYWGGNPISPFFITWHFSFFSVIKLSVNEKRQFRNQGQFCTTIFLYIRNKMDRKRCILCYCEFSLV